MKILDSVESKMRPIPWVSWDDKYRFYFKVNQLDNQDCWNWTGGKVDGYGVFSIQSEPYIESLIILLMAN